LTRSQELKFANPVNLSVDDTISLI